MAQIVQWEDYLPIVLATKPAKVVQEACEVLEKHGCPVKELKSELYYSSTLCQVVFQVLHSANLIVAHAPTVWTALMHTSTICWRMHSNLCDERSSHAHTHANTLTVEITSNARVIWKAHMHVMCVSVFYIWATVWLNYHSSVECSFWLLNHTLLSKIPALDVREYTATINADITLKWKQRRNNGCLHKTSTNEVDCAVP